jgi:uncharacterized RDD family membrane protein YckC|nr:RDD family protein [Candidatus Krumholzibacteria bacterium]
MADQKKPNSRPPKDTEARNPLDLVSPEGVPLTLEIALAGDRATAFLIDVLCIAVVIAAIQLLGFLTMSVELVSIGLIVTFLVRNFYFMFFEQRWQGSTPGKRNRGLRVIDVSGGLLSVEAIIVRNLTRDVEIFLPLMLVFFPEYLWPGAPPWAIPLAGLWMLVLGLMPLFNRQRRRVGDLIAGTVVIASPQVELLGDLAASSPSSSSAAPTGKFVFSRDQLGVYGVYELQVLEKVLRRSGFDEAQVQMATVREKICAKIGWEDEVKDDEKFLRAFYAAQRAHLEGRMLLGDRREDKFGGTEISELRTPPNV